MGDVEIPEGYEISCDPARLDLGVIHRFIALESYWAKGIPPHLVERMIQNSLIWGVYQAGAQIGFARVVTDKATFAYLCDVFVLTEHRGKGLSKALVAAVLAHPELQGLRRWVLVTADAQSLYKKFGFKMIAKPERYMEIHRPGIYESP